MSKEKEKTPYEEQMKNTCVNVLKSLGYEVELKVKPKMLEPFLKKGDEFWYVTECPLQVVNAMVVGVGWNQKNGEILEVKFEVNPTNIGKTVTDSFLIEPEAMGTFYFRSPVGALKRAQRILEENNTKQGELYQ